jgi:uncharacterized protein (TIGR02646 family)
MIKIADLELPDEASRLLKQYQAEVDRADDYGARVNAAKSEFKRRNIRSNPAFVAVRAQLTGMCSGIGRCMYCEDAPADEVEHHRPKDLYPELVFAWRNFLYACGPCNGPKNNRFAVIDGCTGEVVDVARGRHAPMIPPAPGAPALLDPRREDPLDYLMLDLRDTFEFSPYPDLDSVGQQRAEYTIEVLRLNQRDQLAAARENAFGGYRARLREYVQRRSEGATPEELTRLKAGFRTSPHVTVWVEMQRQHRYHPVLAELFAATPEALDF